MNPILFRDEYGVARTITTRSHPRDVASVGNIFEVKSIAGRFITRMCQYLTLNTLSEDASTITRFTVPLKQFVRYEQDFKHGVLAFFKTKVGAKRVRKAMMNGTSLGDFVSWSWRGVNRPDTPPRKVQPWPSTLATYTDVDGTEYTAPDFGCAGTILENRLPAKDRPRTTVEWDNIAHLYSLANPNGKAITIEQAAEYPYMLVFACPSTYIPAKWEAYESPLYIKGSRKHPDAEGRELIATGRLLYTKQKTPHLWVEAELVPNAYTIVGQHGIYNEDYVNTADVPRHVWVRACTNAGIEGFAVPQDGINWNVKLLPDLIAEIDHTTSETTKRNRSLALALISALTLFND